MMRAVRALWRCRCFKKRSACYECPLDGEWRYSDVTVMRCMRCKRLWLEYRFEIGGITASGRWYWGEIDLKTASELTASNAHLAFADMPWYLGGGSYFKGKILRLRGPLHEVQRRPARADAAARRCIPSRHP